MPTERLGYLGIWRSFSAVFLGLFSSLSPATTEIERDFTPSVLGGSPSSGVDFRQWLSKPDSSRMGAPVIGSEGRTRLRRERALKITTAGARAGRFCLNGQADRWHSA